MFAFWLIRVVWIEKVAIDRRKLSTEFSDNLRITPTYFSHSTKKKMEVKRNKSVLLEVRKGEVRQKATFVLGVHWCVCVWLGVYCLRDAKI